MALSEVNRQLVERVLGAPLLYMDLDRAELDRLLDAARSEPDERVKGLVEANEALLAAMSWIESPFVEGADESELRNRIKFACQDAERAQALITALLSQPHPPREQV